MGDSPSISTSHLRVEVCHFLPLDSPSTRCARSGSLGVTLHSPPSLLRQDSAGTEAVRYLHTNWLASRSLSSYEGLAE